MTKEDKKARKAAEKKAKADSLLALKTKDSSNLN